MPVNNLFLKTDSAGKRQPTLITYVLIVLFVLFSCFISKNKKPTVKKNVKQTIIKLKDLTAPAVANTHTIACHQLL